MYHYRIQVITESHPANFEMELTVIGRQNKMKYVMPFDMSLSSSLLFVHDSSDGFQGPIEKAVLRYRDLPSIIYGAPIRFVVYAINITYMSHLDMRVRDKFSSVICTDYLEEGQKELRQENLNEVTLTFTARQCAKNDQQLVKYVAYARMLIANNTELQRDLAAGLYNCSAPTLINTLLQKDEL